MEEESSDFERPPVPEWDAFEDAAVKLFYDWEVRSLALYSSRRCASVTQRTNSRAYVFICVCCMHFCIYSHYRYE